MKISLSCSNCILNFNSSTHEVVWCLSNTSVYSMLSGIIFLFLWNLRSFSGASLCTLFFINSDTFSTKYSSFFLFYLFLDWSLSFWWLFIIKWRCKVNINISVNDANSVIGSFRVDFKNINIKLFIKSSNCDGVSFMQTSEVSQLILQNSFWIACLNEFSSMWSKFYHVLSSWTLFFHIRN